MTTASYRFFQIPELDINLASKLDKPTLTNFYAPATTPTPTAHPSSTPPSIFSTVGPGFRTTLVDSVESLEILAKNVHHIHELTSGPLFSVLLYNCLLAYHKQYPPRRRHRSGKKTLLRLPRIDPPTETLTPIPPLAHLKKFTYTQPISRSDFMRNHTFMLSSRYPRIRQAQLYWFPDSMLLP